MTQLKARPDRRSQNPEPLRSNARRAGVRKGCTDGIVDGLQADEADRRAPGGLSETSPMVCANRVDAETYGGKLGLPVPSTEVAILDDRGTPLPLGEYDCRVVKVARLATCSRISARLPMLVHERAEQWRRVVRTPASSRRPPG